MHHQRGLRRCLAISRPMYTVAKSEQPSTAPISPKYAWYIGLSVLPRFTVRVSTPNAYPAMYDRPIVP